MRAAGVRALPPIDDAGFVRAPVELVDARLACLAGWPDWWPGLRLRPAPTRVGGPRVVVELRGSVGRRLRAEAHVEQRRIHAGLVLRLHGALEGTWELWLEPTGGGTVVHHVVAAATGDPRPARVAEELRRAIRRGLWGCKDALQLEARTSAGLDP